MNEDFRETLYTIDRHGKRKWVYATVIRGFFYKRRALVMYSLLLFYVLMPWVTIHGTQGILLNFTERKFTFFGTTFWATDTKFLALVLLSLGVSLFFFSALLGRIWCGWACPETVFVEFVFRPIEILIEGSPAKRKRRDESPWDFDKLWRKGLKYLLFSIVAWFLASTFLAYFVGREPLLQMMSDVPSHNLSPFVATCALMSVILFQFGWFREQFCTALCPYARFQSVLLDSHSLLVGYDAKRGEPRGRLHHDKAAELGDCIDCGLCVRVCPTGIDIRNGLQLECIQCAACADACDSIMEQINKPVGLVRYSTEAALGGGKTQFLRPRVVLYGLVLIALLSTLTLLLDTRKLGEFQVVRGATDIPFSILPDARISNHLHVHIANKDLVDHKYSITVNLAGVEAIAPLQPFPVSAGSLATMEVFFNFSPKLLSGGSLPITVSIHDEASFSSSQLVTLVGPES